MTINPDYSKLPQMMIESVIDEMTDLSPRQREWLKCFDRLEREAYGSKWSSDLFTRAYVYFLDSRDSKIFEKWDRIITENRGLKETIQALIDSIPKLN